MKSKTLHPDTNKKVPIKRTSSGYTKSKTEFTADMKLAEKIIKENKNMFKKLGKEK